MKLISKTCNVYFWLAFMKNLGGSISGKQFNLFTDLVNLNLSFNSFSKKFPVGIFNLTSLRSLDISRNNFSGQFPNGVSNFQNLVVLDAFSNNFFGPLPTDVSQIPTLKSAQFCWKLLQWTNSIRVWFIPEPWVHTFSRKISQWSQTTWTG